MRASHCRGDLVTCFECRQDESAPQAAARASDHPTLLMGHGHRLARNWTQRLVSDLLSAMARPRTKTQVHDAVLGMAVEDGVARITMEGVAARAGVSKQTLYRSWPSTGAILFDALLARSTNGAGEVVVPSSDDLAEDLETLVASTIAEITDPVQERLLRVVAADMQTDENLASEFRTRLMAPQLRAIADRFAREGIEDPDDAAELLLGAIVHRWLLRTRSFQPDWIRSHVRRVLLATKP